MGQITRSIALEVRPSHRDKLVQLLTALRGDARPDQAVANAAFLRAIPTAHFFSISVVDSADYDALLVLEANFDGKPGPFWAQLQAFLGDALRQMLRCCKRPRDGSRALYDAIVAPGSCCDPVPYLIRHAMRPRVYFHGTRGLTRERILAEAALAEAAQARLGNGGGAWRTQDAPTVHRTLRTALVASFPWLDDPEPKRIPAAETIFNWIKLGLFLFAALFACMIPGTLFAAILKDGDHLWLLGAVAIPLLAFLAFYRRPQPEVGTGTTASTPPPVKFKLLPVVVVLAAGYLLSWPIVTVAVRVVDDLPWAQCWDEAARQAAWGLGWVVLALLPLATVWLRYLERHDSSLSDPVDNPRTIAEMAADEDWLPQNHMVSVVSLRPQLLRRVLAYFATTAVKLALQAIVRNGYLQSMRTIHFAHWAFVNNGSRMLFLSNYDFSWETYFDDFIEKAHQGMTLIWGGSVGFPPTTMLIQDGSAHGRMFKRWARHSMAPTRFWVSAYPRLTVDQIFRNHRIAKGLRAASLSPRAAATWIADL